MTEDLRKLDCQSFIDDLCTECRRVDELLGQPRMGPERYQGSENGKQVFHVIRYARNVRVMMMYEAMINRLDVCFVSLEYFQGHTRLKRLKEPEFSPAFEAQFFVSTIVDSFRSTLDIYAKVVGSYFDLDGAESLGFAYKGLIEPLKAICPDLANACNTLYKNEHFQLIKEFRDNEKHVGHPDLMVKIKADGDQMEVQFKRTDPIEAQKLARSAGNCLRPSNKMTNAVRDDRSGCIRES